MTIPSNLPINLISYSVDKNSASGKNSGSSVQALAADNRTYGFRPDSMIPVASSVSDANSEKTGNDKTKNEKNLDSYKCQTCKNRKYQDGSDDPGVSFKTPSKLSPEQASTAVRAHEYEHVSHERAAAARENREIVSQSVTYQTSICPECGSAYTSGGTTRTVTKGEVDQTYQLGQKEEKGTYLDVTA